MHTLEVHNQTLTVQTDPHSDMEDRVEGHLAGEWGASVAHTSGEPIQNPNKNQIGFVPPDSDLTDQDEIEAIRAIFRSIIERSYTTAEDTSDSSVEF